MIRGFPNGTTLLVYQELPDEYIARVEQTRGSETSQYPQEKKSTEILLVAASERGIA
jgi:hypothetical protein